jgi:murein DD-endopeptidase MepM/ murein hydrolase activator NlpD
VRTEETARSDTLSLGAPVLAVADGTVVSVVENHADDGSFDPRDSVKDINALCGNYIVLDLGDDTFALYAHLQQDSVVVEPGQRVRRGEVIARVGHSGSSMFPHLHFQLMDGPDFRAEGVPALFRDFVRVRGDERTRIGRGAIATGDVVETRPH